MKRKAGTQYTFHNPNSDAQLAQCIYKLLLEASLPLVQREMADDEEAAEPETQ